MFSEHSRLVWVKNTRSKTENSLLKSTLFHHPIVAKASHYLWETKEGRQEMMPICLQIPLLINLQP